jgi:glycine cleavage system regulatory protein
MGGWVILSAIGCDRPGLAADPAQLVFDCGANLEGSRMTDPPAEQRSSIVGQLGASISSEAAPAPRER